jgi:hypothetical protein
MRLHRFRLLFAAFSGAFLVLGSIVPRADALLVTYFNFEDTTLGNPILTAMSQPPGAQSSMLTISVSGGIPQATSTQGVDANVAPGDMVANLHGAGFVTTTGGTATLSFMVNTIGLTNLSLSFATNNNGNGFSTAIASFTTSGGGFGSVTQPILNGPKNIVTFDFSSFNSGINNINNQTSVTFSIELSGGKSMGSDLQTIVDNIQLNATPEPPTTATGALAILGLCWFRRRWLTRFLLLRRSPGRTGRLHRTFG